MLKYSWIRWTCYSGTWICENPSVKIPVSISDRTFEKRFNIAYGITTERILVMDFLEDNKCVFDVAKRQITFKQLVALSHVSTSPTLTVTFSNVALEKTVLIPASCEIEVMAQLSSREDHG